MVSQLCLENNSAALGGYIDYTKFEPIKNDFYKIFTFTLWQFHAFIQYLVPLGSLVVTLCLSCLYKAGCVRGPDLNLVKNAWPMSLLLMSLCFPILVLQVFVTISRLSSGT